MTKDYNFWNKHIPRSLLSPDPAQVHKRIGSKEYHGKSLKGKKAEKAALVAKVTGVAIGTIL